MLDYVSRPEVWAALWRPLLRGYCLDALDRATSGPTVSEATADDFLATTGVITPVRHEGIGMGHIIALDSEHAAGTGIMLGGELIQVSVFAG